MSSSPRVPTLRTPRCRRASVSKFSAPRLAAIVALPVACLSTASLSAQAVRTTAVPSSQRSAPQSSGRVVNAPVAPEALMISFGGDGAGLGVLDLNGFGQGTGDPAISNFPRNPNVGRPGVFPPLMPGVDGRTGGGAGPLTLTTDSLGNTRLTEPGSVGVVSALALGQPLDLVFNNGNININATSIMQVNPATGTTMPGNTIMVAPHPNPPPLVFPSPNPMRGIDAEEPTVTSSVGPDGFVLTQSPPCLPSPVNLLQPGDPFGTMPGIFGASFPGVFYGPQPAPPSPPPPPVFCPFTSRQQVGQFLYALDPLAGRVVVLNSNRQNELASIDVPTPTAMAMAPNLQRLAVASAATGQIFVIDTNPLSQTFHQVVARRSVGRGVTAMAWQPEGEDLLVVSDGRGRRGGGGRQGRGAGRLLLLDGVDLRVRRVLVDGRLRGAVDVIATARQVRFAFETGTWFGYVLCEDGRVVVFESGPQRIGADAVIGQLPHRFPGGTTLQPDAGTLDSAFYVAHTDSAGAGRVSRVALTDSPRGPQPVRGRSPLRRRTWSVTDVYDGFGDGAPRDVAVDEIVNAGGHPDARSPLVPGLDYAIHSGKGLVKLVDGCPTPATQPSLLMVATSDGTLVVKRLDDGAELRRIAGQDVRVLGGYFRQ